MSQQRRIADIVIVIIGKQEVKDFALPFNLMSIIFANLPEAKRISRLLSPELLPVRLRHYLRDCLSFDES